MKRNKEEFDKRNRICSGNKNPFEESMFDLGMLDCINIYIYIIYIYRERERERERECVCVTGVGNCQFLSA